MEQINEAGRTRETKASLNRLLNGSLGINRTVNSTWKVNHLGRLNIEDLRSENDFVA